MSAPRSLRQTSPSKNGYGRQPAFWRAESSPVAGFVKRMPNILPSYIYGSWVHRFRNCELCWTIGPKSHAAAGRKFVVVLHVALEDLANPFPLRFLQPVLRPEHYSSIMLFRWMNCSASQATQDALVGTPHPPRKGISRCGRTLILPVYIRVYLII